MCIRDRLQYDPIHLVYNVGDYKIIQHAACHHNEGGNIHTLKEAKRVCSLDTHCVGFKDNDCMGFGFQLCKKNILISAPITSCVHKKEEHSGIQIKTNEFSIDIHKYVYFT